MTQLPQKRSSPSVPGQHSRTTRLRNQSKAVVTVLVAALSLDPFACVATAQTPIPESTRARVRAFQASGDRIEVVLLDNTMIRGRVIETTDNAFTVGEELTRQKVTAQYAQVKEVRKWEGNGLSNGARTAIVLGVAGALLLVFCAAPFPLGFLCHGDPS